MIGPLDCNQSDASAKRFSTATAMTGVAYCPAWQSSASSSSSRLQLFCKDTPPRAGFDALMARKYRLFVGINDLLIAVTYLYITPRELSDPVALSLGLNCLLTVALSDERLRAYSRRVLGRLSFAKACHSAPRRRGDCGVARRLTRGAGGRDR